MNQLQQVETEYARLRQLNAELYDLFDQDVQLCEAKINSILPFTLQQSDQIQASSIIAHLNDLNFFQDALVIEVGSGTGQLGLAVAEYLTTPLSKIVFREQLNVINQGQYKKCTIPTNILKTNIFLVDMKQGLKFKNDRYFCFTDFHAIRIVGNLFDLSPQVLTQLNCKRTSNETVYLDKYLNEPISKQNSENNVLSVQKKRLLIAKHLCGPATDCILHYNVERIGIALCCHSKGDGSQYVNPSYIQQFDVKFLHRITSYQHCFGVTDVLTQEQKYKKEIGFKARQILDVGRMLWLKEQGYRVGLKHYCYQQQSGEQWLLWAEKWEI